MEGYIEKNPVTAIDKIKLVDQPPEIFTPEQVQALLEKAPADLLPCVALGAFAGLRTAELLRLEWQDVDLKRGFINVSASKSKTAKRRLIPIMPNLAGWLRPYARGLKGRICPFSARWYQFNIEQTAKAAGLSKWPNNGLRHSFASYHLASHQNAPQLALEMGHTTPRIIFDSYREIVTPEEADRSGISFRRLQPPMSCRWRDEKLYLPQPRLPVEFLSTSGKKLLTLLRRTDEFHRHSPRTS